MMLMTPLDHTLAGKIDETFEVSSKLTLHLLESPSSKVLSFVSGAYHD